MTAKWNASFRALLGVLLLIAAACSGSEPAEQADVPGEPDMTPSAASVRLVEVARVEAPVGMTTRAGDSAIYVIEETGKVRILRDGEVDPQPVVDLGDEVSGGSEQGLLGIAFSPDGQYVYLNYTDRDGHTHVTEWTLNSAGAVDQASRREVLFQEQPFANHNGGQLAFGPDGFLYIGLGDGGSGGDPQGNAQNLNTLLGKVLRINPRPSAGQAYGVPNDNPFVDRPNAKPEIWAYGLRNPWRFSFDQQTGDLWISDVGQSSWEEINRQSGGSSGGANYGWNFREGSHEFTGEAPADAIDPVIEYATGPGGTCSVIGGLVYRGDTIPGLNDHYLYGDFCAGWVNTVPISGESVGAPQRLLDDLPQLSSFGVDNSGGLYVLQLDGAISRLEPA